jgi:F-type H+-transporting ATPase subunit delta
LALEESYGAGITTSFSHDPALIGGMRIRVGSDVYDGSIQNRLASLEKRIAML